MTTIRKKLDRRKEDRTVEELAQLVREALNLFKTGNLDIKDWMKTAEEALERLEKENG